ncbi:MAG: ATP-binding protein [Myxococcota bacterium]
MSRVHLILGPVGSGKSTLARSLAAEHGAVRFALDEWFPVLFSMDRPQSDVVPWYVARAERCVEQIWRVSCSVLDVGRDVVLELGLVRRDQRAAFLARPELAAHDLTAWLVDAPRDVRRARVLQRNEARGETFSMVVPLETFELASDLWQPLDDAERAGLDVRDVG